MTEYDPIYVDGVDVRMCKYAIPTTKYIKCAINWMHCDELDCYYKQLKHKTQECEYWKHQAELGSDTTNRFAKQLEGKEQEYEELKERFKKFHDRKLDEKADLLCKLHKEECLRFKAEQKLELIRKKLQAYIDDEADLTPEQVLQIIDEVN